MQYLKNYFEYLRRFEPVEDHRIDRGHNLFLVGALMSRKPRQVLELGIGTGYLTVGMMYALRYNGVGDLTCVDDWSLWGGEEPTGIETLRDGGVNVLAPVNVLDHLESCNADAYDFIVADGRLLGDHTMDHLYRIARDDAFLFIRNTLRGLDPGRCAAAENWLRKKKVGWYHFTQSSRSDERRGDGSLFAIFSKTPEMPRDAAVGRGGALKAADESTRALSPRASAGRSTARPDLYLGLVSGKNYGWGVCSENLIRELSRKITCHVLNEKDGSDRHPALDGTLFQALTGVDFFPMFEHARGRENLGYTFFENELTPTSVENAKRFDTVLAGSSWCRDRMLEKGIANCGVLIQGVDPRLFYPISQPSENEGFVVFSGGKFELRKGQDLVLRAIKVLQEKYEDIVLVNCWYNIWPESMKWMAHSRHIEFEYRELPWTELMMSVYRANGLDSERIRTLELVPNDMQRSLYRQTDLGVFPNRCEGGTNLVMMEYMACAKPVVAANSSGHADIVSAENALLLNELKEYNIVGPDNRLLARWEEPSLEELVAQIEYAYHHRDEIHSLARRAGQDMKSFTWEHTARRLLEILKLRQGLPHLCEH